MDSRAKIRFLDAEVTSPGKADWVLLIIAVPILGILGAKFPNMSVTIAGVLLGFTLSAFGVSILRSPKAFFTLLGGITIVYALVRFTFE